MCAAGATQKNIKISAKRVQRYGLFPNQQNFLEKKSRKKIFFNLIDRQTVANFDLMVGIEVIFLVQRLQPDAVFLGNGIHAFARLNDMGRFFEGFVGSLLLFLQIDDVALDEPVVSVTLVVLGKFPIGKPDFLGNRLERVAISDNDVEIFIVDSDDVLVLHGHRGMVLGIGRIVLVELIEFDELNQLLGVLRIRRIATFLQTVGPTFVVGPAELEQAFVARGSRQKTAVILETFLRRIVCAEALLRLVVVVIDGSPRPPVTLDAEMVVALPTQLAASRATFKDSLRQRDARRNVVATHFVDGDVFVLIDIVLIPLDDLLRIGSEAAEGNDDDGKQDFSHFSLYF